MAVPDRLRRLPWKLRFGYGERLASELRRLAVLATNTHADVRIDRPVRIGRGFRLYMPDGGRFHVGPGCDFRHDFVCEISNGASVEIGAHTTFTSSTLIQISTRLTIGTRCAFGQATQIVDGNHRWRDPDVHPLDQGYDFTPIDIGDDCIVFSKTTIFAPMGRRAIVAAHSLVNAPVPEFCLVAGTPARIVEYYGPPDRRPPDLPGE